MSPWLYIFWQLQLIVVSFLKQFSTPGLAEVKNTEHKIQSKWKRYRIQAFVPQCVTIITNNMPLLVIQLSFFDPPPRRLWEFGLEPGLQDSPWSRLRSVKNWRLSVFPSSVIYNHLSKACLRAMVCCWGTRHHGHTPPFCLSSFKSLGNSQVKSNKTPFPLNTAWTDTLLVFRLLSLAQCCIS